MKKLIIILLAVLAVGCKSLYQEPTFTIGMPETAFKRANPKAELITSSEDGMSIYRTYQASFMPLPEPYSFFYFYQGKLSRFVKSDRLDDYKFIR